MIDRDTCEKMMMDKFKEMIEIYSMYDDELEFLNCMCNINRGTNRGSLSIFNSKLSGKALCRCIAFERKENKSE